MSIASFPPAPDAEDDVLHLAPLLDSDAADGLTAEGLVASSFSSPSTPSSATVTSKPAPVRAAVSMSRIVRESSMASMDLRAVMLSSPCH